MCALFGIHDYNDCFNKRQKEIIISVLSQECQVRGTDATGIAYIRDGKLQVYKRPMPASAMQYNLPPTVKTVMGHTRMTTQGSEKNNFNNHPFFGRVKDNTFTLAHNGILRNDKEIRESMKLPQTNIETDSYIAVQIIEHANSVTFDSLRKVAETVTGSFVFTVLDGKDNLYFIRGDNPICIYHFDKGFYLYASTEEILSKTISRLGIDKYNHKKVPVDYGDILRIDSNGNLKKEPFAVTDYYSPRYGYYQYPMYLYEQNDTRNYGAAANEYLEMLKQMAGLYGYSPEDIDEMVASGFSCDEIEEIIYYGSDIYEDELCYERIN